MFQHVIDTLVRVREMPVSTWANPYTPTREDLVALRIEEMIISQSLQKDGLRKYLSELPDEDFLAQLPEELRRELKGLINNYDPKNWGMRDAILGAATDYRAAKTREDESKRAYFRRAAIGHLRAVGYQEHEARQIIHAAIGSMIAIEAVRWVADVFRQELKTHPKYAHRGTDTWKCVRKGTKFGLLCMLRGIVAEGREDHISNNIIKGVFKARGYHLPVGITNRASVLGFLEAARLALVNMPRRLVRM